ncbi:MAG: nitroreductase [Betaproteobacteria bacterium]
MDYPHSYRFVDDAIISRHSIRAYLPKPVGDEIVSDILDVARRAPSGTNMQPWRVPVLTGEKRRVVCERVVAAFDDPEANAQHSEEYNYYPKQWFSPYIERRRTVGYALYALLGIAKGEKAKMHAQHARNFRFFDAPVGLVFTIDRRLEIGSWLDYGMFLQNIMVAARARGLDTCPQAAFAQFHRILSAELELPEHEQVVCGMSLGYADMSAPENALISEREPVENFSRFWR